MHRLAWLVPCLIAAAVQRAAAAPADPISWFGFTMGTQVAAYRATMGDPLLLTKFPDAAIAAGMKVGPDAPIERKARYLLSVTGPVFGIVTEGHGTVDGLEMFAPRPAASPRLDVPADPNGVHLGDSEADLATHVPNIVAHGSMSVSRDVARNTTTIYTIIGGHVGMIAWSTTGDRGAPPGPGSYADIAGDTMATAIVEMQPTDNLGNLWERAYYALHPCDGAKGVWRERASALVNADAHVYDHNTVACATSGATREYWFDITASFGKH